MKTVLSLLVFAALNSASAFAKEPINETCPVCGKPGRVIYRTFSDKGPILFATAECKDAYQKEPTRYTVKPKAAK